MVVRVSSTKYQTRGVNQRAETETESGHGEASARGEWAMIDRKVGG